MRRGPPGGLTDEQVRSFLEPGFLAGWALPCRPRAVRVHRRAGRSRHLPGAGDVREDLDGRHASPMSAQTDVFDAFSVLRAAYMSQAGAVPPDLASAEEMLSLANQGYGPAQKTVQVFIAGGNHPSAGAQNSGGVAGMRATVYDLSSRTTPDRCRQRRPPWPTAGRTTPGSSGSPHGSTGVPTPTCVVPAEFPPGLVGVDGGARGRLLTSRVASTANRPFPAPVSCRARSCRSFSSSRVVRDGRLH